MEPRVDAVVASHKLSAGRPCERRDPSPLASKVKNGLCSSAELRVRAAAMSAIALTLGSLRSQGRLVETPRKTGKFACGRHRRFHMRFPCRKRGEVHRTRARVIQLKAITP